MSLQAGEPVTCGKCGRRAAAFSMTCVEAGNHADLCRLDHAHTLRCMWCWHTREANRMAPTRVTGEGAGEGTT